MRNPAFLNSIALLRVIAVSTVFYCHLIGDFTRRESITWWPHEFLCNYVFNPLHLMKYSAEVGVAIFFLVSGYIIPYVARGETLREYVLKRFFRIYPPFWAALFFTVIAFSILSFFGIKPYGFADYKSIYNFILNASLLNFLIKPEGNLSGVSWTLFIEVLFYSWVAIVFPLLFNKPKTTLFITFGVLVSFFVSLSFTPFFGKLITYGQFVSFMFLGTLIYLRDSRLIGSTTLYIGTIFFWYLFIAGIHIMHGNGTPQFSHAQHVISYALAYIIFCIALFFEKNIKPIPVLSHISKISYSLYIFHGGVGLITIKTLYPIIGFTWALMIALAVIVAFCTASYKFIEAPSTRLSRALISTLTIRRSSVSRVGA